MTKPLPYAPRDRVFQAWGDRPLTDRLGRMGRTPEDVAGLIRGRDEAIRRPAEDGWSALEAVCHLRDIDDISLLRFRMMLQMDEPMVPASVMPDDREAWGLIEEGAALIDPARWARDRQYLRSDPQEALDAFRRLRSDLLTFLDHLRDDQWSRGSIHPTFGRLSYEDWTALLSWHDDNHVAQIESALAAGGDQGRAGRPQAR